MQQAANDLNQDRETRLAALTAREQAEMEADEVARAKNAKVGGRAEFMNGMSKKAGDIDLAGRIQRGRRGLERDEQEVY